ncbi:MAG: hypothetical protein Q8Q60_00570 [Candidatus Chromulinivorax sp.]|nr:hypothetical protein [Candidatus Chromulinivorax sp.]
MEQFYNFNLLYLLLIVCSNQVASSPDNYPSKKQRLTLDQDAYTNASSKKPRYHTRSVTRRMAQRDEKLAGQLAFYKNLETKHDASATYKDLIKTFNYLDLPIDMQREVSEFFGVDRHFDYKIHLRFDYQKNSYLRIYQYNSPLQKAINNHDGDQVQILLALHANINGTACACKQTPLYKSIEGYAHSHDKISKIKSYAIFKYLLQKKADYNKLNPDTTYENSFDAVEIPVWVAISHSTTTPLLQNLLDLPNINLHIKNEDGHTIFDCAKLHAMSPWHEANRRKHFYNVCQVLESKGAPSSIVLEPMPTDEELLRQWIEE